MFCNYHLPPAVLNCDSLSTFKSRLKTQCFILLSVNYSTYLFRQRFYSRLTALWSYINFVLLLSLLLLKFIDVIGKDIGHASSSPNFYF